jgi:hypothetical protein
MMQMLRPKAEELRLEALTAQALDRWKATKKDLPDTFVRTLINQTIEPDELVARIDAAIAEAKGEPDSSVVDVIRELQANDNLTEEEWMDAARRLEELGEDSEPIQEFAKEEWLDRYYGLES